METKFTPGPWSFVEHSWRESTVYDHNDQVVCTFNLELSFPDVNEDTQEEFEALQDANVRLIAAAPDLFEALHRIFHDEKMQVGIGGNPHYVDAFVADAMATLAKALGQGGSDE